jgi:uncharacterized repeat protein (TIGR02543 family)
MSMFDFDQNGEVELVYRDEKHLRIIDKDGEDIESIDCTSATHTEYPIVVDLDRDGHADILVSGGTVDYSATRLICYGSKTPGQWASARSVWNQHAYNATNINDDLSIPRYPMNPAMLFSSGRHPYNAFLQQQTALSVDGVPYWATPNVGITATPPVFNYHADGDSLTVAFEIANTGDAGLQAPFYISAYKDEALAANRMDTDSFPTAINQGDTLPVTLTIDSLSKFLPLTDIIIRINDRGQGAYVQPECDTLSNNTLDVPAADLLLAYDDYVSIVTGTSVTIPVLDNDITPAVCPANTLQMDIIGAQSGISTLIGTGNLLNISDLQPGLNTVTYMITCDNSTSTASVYVYVAETPDNISVANCYAPVHQTVWDIERKTVSDREVFWLATPFVGDLDGDGRVEVVAPGNNSTSNASSLLVFDDSLRWIRSITPMDNANFFPNYATMTFLIADVNNDGKGEIVTATTNGNNHALLCFTYEGNELWGGRTVPFGASGQNSLIVADINSDGYAEILAGNSLFDGEKGTLLLTLPAGGRGYNGNNPYASMPVFANMDNDGLQEIVAGNTVYKVTITNRTGTAGNKAEILAQMTGFPDGYTSVADIDLDGDLDVIVTGGGATDNTAILYVWDGATPVQIGQTLSFASSGKSISRAFAGDIDKDGRPDIAFTYVNRIAAYSYNSGNNTFQQLWTNETTDLSGATAMSMFDFDQDGYVELVYRDMKNLRIIDRLGNDIITFPCYSGTHTEYPVVVDLDRDGHADILVSGSETAITIDPPTATGISLIRYGSKTPGQWASARSVWNQHAYNATNINENLRVPRSPMNPATVFPGPDDLNTLDDVRPYNAFLKQQTTLSKDGMPFWPLPDAVFDDTQPVTVTLDGDSVSIILCIANRGSAALGSPVYASLYRDSVKLENLLATDSLAGYIYPGDTACLTVGAGNISSEPFVQLVVRLNDNGKFDGNGDPIYPAQDECDCSDSIRARLSPVLYLMMKKDASIDNVSNRGTYPNPVSVLYSDTIKYTITAVNANLSPTGTLVIRDTLPAYLNYAGDGTRSSSRPPSSFVSNPTVGIPPRDTLTWTFDNVPSMEKVTVTFGATPAGGVSASQPMFVNRAWITASDTIHVPTDSSTYHQGAGVSVVTFSAPAKGGDIYNATPQALDYRTSPRSGILVVPDEGYAFAGWSHDGYTSLRGERIEARTGIMQYDTLTVYGSVELRAVFAPEEYSVRYHLHGGENPEGNPPAYTVESAAVTLVAPSKASDVFTGWTGANGDDPQAEVTIPHGSTGERDYYANYLYSGREDVEAPTSASEDKIWSFEDELYVRTAKAGSTVRVYTPDGILHRLQTVVAAGETRIKLQRGVYIVTINNGAGQKVMIE